MPNRAAHALGAAIIVGGISAKKDMDSDGEITLKTLAASFLAGKLGSLPDLLEPATNPRHRQFFHSILVAGALGYGIHQLYSWKPVDDREKFVRWVLLVAGGAYATHLAMDSIFSRSGLPLVGKL